IQRVIAGAAIDGVTAGPAAQSGGRSGPMEFVVALRAAEGDRRGAGRLRGQQDIDGVVRVDVAGVRKHGRFGAEHILVSKRGGEARDAVALDDPAIGIEDHDAAVLMIWVDARHVIVGNREQRVGVKDEDAGGAPHDRVIDVGDRIVVDRALRPGKGARRTNLHAVLAGRFPVTVPVIVLSWISTVSVAPLTKMPSFWKLLTVECSIVTVWGPLPPWLLSWLVAMIAMLRWAPGSWSETIFETATPLMTASELST